MARKYKTLPGVYKMINLQSGNFYIGSTKDISVRISSHKSLLKKGYPDNIRIREDLNTYGIESFEFEVIEYCDLSDCLQKEQYYYETLKPFYNIWPTIYSASGRSYTKKQLLHFKKCAEKKVIKDKKAFKEKLKRAWKRRRLTKEGRTTLQMLDKTGMKHSEETKELFRKQRKGRKISEKHREKIRKARSGTKWDSVKNTWVKKYITK